jgi:hypothetical protein
MKPIVMSGIVLGIVWALIIGQFLRGGSTQTGDAL